MRYGNPYRTQKLSDILINKTLDKIDYNLIKGNVELYWNKDDKYIIHRFVMFHNTFF